MKGFLLLHKIDRLPTVLSVFDVMVIEEILFNGVKRTRIHLSNQKSERYITVIETVEEILTKLQTGWKQEFAIDKIENFNPSRTLIGCKSFSVDRLLKEHPTLRLQPTRVIDINFMLRLMWKLRCKVENETCNSESTQLVEEATAYIRTTLGDCYND